MTAPGGASVETVELVRAGGDHIPGLLARVEEHLRSDASGHGAILAQHGGETIAAGGKRLRPLLVLLAAGEPSGGEVADALVRAGAAVELVHSATLVHDDVLDAASLRRGRPTVVAVAGRDMATATGDLLFARAFTELTDGGRAGPRRGRAHPQRRLLGAGARRAAPARGRVGRLHHASTATCCAAS